MNFEKLDTFLSGMEARGIPFCDTVVFIDGKPVYRHMEGYSDIKQTKPVSKNDFYVAYSISKVTTSVAALRTIEKGLLSIDDPVSKYIPAASKLMVKEKDGTIHPAQNTMLVKHLFTMTGGMNYDIHSDVVKEACEKGITATVPFISYLFEHQPLDFEPGTRYQYSLCHDALAAVVEVANGMRFADFCKQEIFEPLHMDETVFHVNEEQKKRLSCHYGYNNAKFEATQGYELVESPFIFGPDYDSGGAGIFTTTDSYGKLCAALSNGGVSTEGYVLLKPETLEMITQNYMEDTPLAQFGVGRFAGYTFGLCGRVHLRPEISLSPSAIGEFGWDSAGNAYLMADYQNRIGILYMTHVHGCGYGYDKLHPALRNTVYECIFDK